MLRRSEPDAPVLSAAYNMSPPDGSHWGRRQGMLATDVLKKNHQAILELFDRYRRTGRGDSRKKKALFDQIKRALRTHLCLEEEMLYPAMTRTPSPEAGRRLDGVLQEHLYIDDLLMSLSETRPQDREFDLRIDALRRKVDEHFHLE